MAKLSQKEKAAWYDAMQVVEKFNQLFPVLSEVQWRPIAFDDVPYQLKTVMHEAFVSSSGEPVAMLSDRRGWCSVAPEFVDYETTVKP